MALFRMICRGHSRLAVLVISMALLTVVFLYKFQAEKLEVSGQSPPLEYPESRKNVSHNGICLTEKKRTFEAYDKTENIGNWKDGTFCHDFFTATFQKSISVCRSTSDRSVSCFGNDLSNSMATCVLENIIVHPQMLAIAMNRVDHVASAKFEPFITLLDGCGTRCDDISLSHFLNHTDSSDYIAKMIEELKLYKLGNHSLCKKWIEEGTFFFTAKRAQIYFRFLDYFNLHKLIEDFASAKPEKIRIIRISGGNNYFFPKFDLILFPKASVQTVDELENVLTCFRRIVLIPKSYSSTLFQCKMTEKLLQNCLLCSGRGYHNTQINTFRNRVLSACNLKNVSNQDMKFVITVVSRNPYLRFPKDNIGNFQRLLENEQRLVLRMKAKFKFALVQIVHLENLSMCEQVKVARMSDVYLGVHGAGLVHLWWLREQSLVYELEPHFEVTNPTFHVLARVSGCKYMKSLTAGDSKYVFARVNDILHDLEDYFKKRMST